jgi:long-chain acyl-CoA synthetase
VTRFADPADAADGANSANCADLVRAAAQRTPDSAALIGAWGTRSWAELDAAIDAGVPVFRTGAPASDGDHPADRVVLALPTGPELAAALFAVFRAGLVAVPVDPLRTDIAWVAQRVGATHVVTDAVVDTSAQITAQITTGAQVAAWWAGDTPAGTGVTAAHDAVRGGAQSGGEDLALLARAARQGPPVMLPHRALIAAAHAISGAGPVAMGPADRVLQALPLFHVVGLVTAFLPAALAGAAVVVPDANGSATPAEAALAAVRTHRVSVLPAEPTLYRQLDRIDGFERALATVRLMTSGSSPLDPVDFATIRTATGQAVREGYGISEAASAVTSTLMSPSAKAGSVGRAYPGVEVRILGDSPWGVMDSAPTPDASTTAEASTDSGDDAGAGTAAAATPGGDETGLGAVIPVHAPSGETGRTAAVLDELTDLVELSAPGEDVGPIAIRGDTLFTGYWPDGRSGPDADGWFVTGDIGYFDDAGELHLVDRAEEAITVAGFTVYPREVEDALARHPLVADAAAVGMPGRAGETVVAALVAKAGTRPTPGDVGEFVATLLPPFKRPTDYRLVDVLPRTEVGRLDRGTVRRDFAASRGIELTPPVRLRPADDPDRAAGSGVGPEADRDQAPERAAGLKRLGRRLPAADSGRGRSARDTDEDLF